MTELAWFMNDKRKHSLSLNGLSCSSAPLFFSALPLSFGSQCSSLYLFILNDADEAGYFYHDLTQILGGKQVLFFPSSYRYSKKFSQKDAANEILRTEVLAATHNYNGCGLASDDGSPQGSKFKPSTLNLFIVTYPDAVAEQVVSQKKLDENTLHLRVGEEIDVRFIEEALLTFGFHQEDYVYEPGQFAIRGSIVDVYSYSCEYPYRIDFFGDEVDTIRTFDVQSQLSRERQEEIEIVSNLFDDEQDMVPFLEVLPDNSVVVTKNLAFVCDVVDDETFSKKILDFKRIELGTKGSTLPSTSSGQVFPQPSALSFDVSPQPLFHKNFELLVETFEDYIAKGYRLYILADSAKQHQRLKEIFEEKSKLITFTPVNKTLHEGFVDNDVKACFFTDHQIFDRFHKYSLRSDKARSGKIALTLKELQQFEYGDLIVHIDHGIGRFEGLVQMPQGNTYQEMIKIGYQNGDTIYVSIHSLHKVSKYRGKEGAENVRLSRLGTGAWENLKERTKNKIKDIARDLIQLYARRRNERGFAFSADCFMQNELEASFLYEDTPDQLKATNDVKADMEKATPMD
ncbi:MAG: CarD family transcriptional regulator, partial [Prevotellaceae bacterium]|nr:CarD family transcriptional regulator [Prevotellaceae bacterium]